MSLLGSTLSGFDILRVQIDAYPVTAIQLRCGHHNAPITRPQIHDRVGTVNAGHFQHGLHDLGRCFYIGRVEAETMTRPTLDGYF